MRSRNAARDALLRLFQRQKIADLDAVLTALESRSRMTAFRRLSAVGYLSAYDLMRRGDWPGAAEILTPMAMK